MAIKKDKNKKPRNWLVVHMLNRTGGGAHNDRKPRSKVKQEIKKHIRSGNYDNI